MPDASTLLVLVAGAFALAALPGPAVIYIVGQSVGQGPRAGVVSALGIATGGLVHVAAATLGVSSLLLSSATAFEVVKLAGAAYLMWLGLRRLLGSGSVGAVSAEPPAPLRHLYRRGVVVNALNPKTALFFLAFLPQFVDPGRAAVPAQMALLGVLFVAVAVISDTGWALLAGWASRWLRERPAALRAERLVGGGVLVALSVVAATARRHAPA